jgi:flavin reductase (DIM6/NTAB) family NADH-FMN oxidoreductase RutF
MSPMIERPQIRNSWSQRDAFFASSFALVGTENADGTTNLVPYQLSLPFRLDSGNPQVLLIARRGARTESNLMRKAGDNKAVFNFIEYDRDLIEDITFLGSPYVSKEDKAERNPFTFDPEHPLRIIEAVQVWECTLDGGDRTDRATYLTFNLDKILVDERWAEQGVPSLPITYGCRNGNQMWYSAPIDPFYVPFPIPEGTDFAAYHRGVPQ